MRSLFLIFLYVSGGLSFSSVKLEKFERSKKTSSQINPGHLVFPGGGIFFYWQAGVVSYLQGEGYDLSRCNFTGASAGALTATLACTGADFYEATDLALQMAAKVGVWNRPLGLQGIWGPLIEEWLDNLLPESVDSVNGRLSLLVTPIPSLGKRKISHFSDREDLLQCNMASVHLPLFLDGKLTSCFRNSPHIDGSFLSTPSDFCNTATESAIWIDWKNDPRMAQKGGLDIVETLSTSGIWNLIELGKSYAETEDMRGMFNALTRCDKK